MNWTTELAPELVGKIDKVDQKIAGRLHEIREVALSNQAKVLAAFRENHVSESHFLPST
ncbi:MAG: methionine gamma-lyase family protein, partial [Enterococcus hulanensis]